MKNVPNIFHWCCSRVLRRKARLVGVAGHCFTSRRLDWTSSIYLAVRLACTLLSVIMYLLRLDIVITLCYKYYNYLGFVVLLVLVLETPPVLHQTWKAWPMVENPPSKTVSQPSRHPQQGSALKSSGKSRKNLSSLADLLPYLAYFSNLSVNYAN
jgi:hypothetical protein